MRRFRILQLLIILDPASEKSFSGHINFASPVFTGCYSPFNSHLQVKFKPARYSQEQTLIKKKLKGMRPNILMLLAALATAAAIPIEPTFSVNSSRCPLCLEENFRDLPFLFRHYIEYSYNRTWPRCSSDKVVFVDDPEGCLTITITKLEDQAFRLYENEMIRIPLGMFGKLHPDTKTVEKDNGKPLKAIFYQPEEVEEVCFVFDFCYDAFCYNDPVTSDTPEIELAFGKSSYVFVGLVGIVAIVAAGCFIAGNEARKHLQHNVYRVSEREYRLGIPSP